jgi:hypothetical protein
LTARLEELREVCCKGGQLYSANPTLASAVARKAKALLTTLTTLRQFLEQPPETLP